MKTFQYKLGDTLLTLTLDEKRGTVSEILQDGISPAVGAEDMPAYAAAIALALIEHKVEVVHDEEADIITVKHYPTEWNSPAKQMNLL